MTTTIPAPGKITEDQPYTCVDCGTTWPSFATYTRKDKECNAKRQARVAARPLPDVDDPAPRLPEGGRPSGGHSSSASSFATEKQVAYIRSLGVERLSDEERKRLEHGTLRRGDASEIIDRLKKATPAQAVEPATEKQVAYLRSLVAEKNHGWPEPELVIAGAIKSRKATSELIDALRTMSRKAPAQRVELEDGIYRNPADGSIFKVYHTVHGANEQVAKRLVVEDGEARFEYEGKRPLRQLTAEMRMTLEEAKAFGAVYGVCCVCAATLTDETSIREGIGPICAKRGAWR